MTEINPLQGLGGLEKLSGAKPIKEIGKESDGQSFDKMLTGFLKDVNHMQHSADESIQKMVAGEVKDVHQVMLAVGEAKVAFNMMLEIRNKTMEAYQELIRMR